MLWQIRHQLQSSDPVSRRNEIRSLLFKNRDLNSPEEQQFFQNPPSPTLEGLLSNLPDLKQDQLALAVNRLKKAITDKEPIIIYGDYDCDGVCSTAILWRTIYDLGGNVKPFIPHRLHHGYGLSEKGLIDALAIFPNLKPLIITVDNGISARAAAKVLKDKGLDLIITDHHTPPADLPTALAVVHTTQLSGSGVAWVLATALRESPAPSLGLSALGTVCDLLPLTLANRQLVIHGLKELRNTSNPGLRALYQVSGITDPSQIDTYHLGYILGPRINAVGRLDHALDALRLLCTSKEETALRIAEKLSALNVNRQDLTYDYGKQAISYFQSLPELPNLLFISSPDYHEGVIGLVASKLTEYFHRPSIVVSLGEDLAKASARSIKSINITELISNAKDLLQGFGGHHQAAGFSASPDNLEQVKALLTEHAASFDPSLFEKTLEIEIELQPDDLNFDQLHLIEEFAPFGVGNPRPNFSSILPISSHRLVGKLGEHLKITPSSPYQSLDIIGFNLANKVPEIKNKNQLAFTLQKNTFNGKTTLQLLLKDLC